MAKKILIVDDEPDFLEMAKLRLEANGYEVIAAKDGQEGVETAKREVPDLIFMDIMMPHLSGGDAVRKLKDDTNTSAIPVIFLTAVLSKQDEGVGQQVNIDNKFYPAIAKPFNPDEFLSIIKKTLDE